VRWIGDASQIYLGLASIQTREGEADRTSYGALHLFGVDVSKFASWYGLAVDRNHQVPSLDASFCSRQAFDDSQDHQRSSVIGLLVGVQLRQSNAHRSRLIRGTGGLGLEYWTTKSKNEGSETARTHSGFHLAQV